MWTRPARPSPYTEATSHVCKYQDHSITVGYWAPDNVEDDSYKWTASAERDILVYLISRQPTVKKEEKHVLLITTRQLCCGRTFLFIPGLIADVLGLVGVGGKAAALPARRFAAVTGRASQKAVREDALRPSTAVNMIQNQAMVHAWSKTDQCQDPSSSPTGGRGVREAAPESASAPATMTAREANELTESIRDAMLRSAGSRRREGTNPIPYIETDLFHLQLQRQMLQTPPGREVLRRPVTEVLGPEIAEKLERHFRLPSDQITSGLVADLSAEDLARILDIDLAGSRRLKLACLGVPLYSPGGGGGGGPGGGGDPGGDGGGPGGRRWGDEGR